jgi:hypothetical protein
MMGIEMKLFYFYFGINEFVLLVTKNYKTLVACQSSGLFLASIKVSYGSSPHNFRDQG